MKISIACDHGGFHTKDIIKKYLLEQGYEIIDFGCNSQNAVDYPDHGMPAVELVTSGEAERAILICGTGLGMSMLANREKGVRAALVYDKDTAKLSREHNNSNVICLGGRKSTNEEILEFIKIWLKTPFSEEQRHIKRLKKFD